MSKPIRQLLAAAALSLGSLSAMAGGNVNWSIGVNLPPAGVVVSNGPVYYPAPVYSAPPVYYPPPRAYYPPAPVVYHPQPVVVYRPAPVIVHGDGRWGHRGHPGWHQGGGRDYDRRGDDRRHHHRD